MKELTKKSSKAPKETQKANNLDFYWVFNPDGSISDFSTYNYLSVLNFNYRPATSSELYLGR